MSSGHPIAPERSRVRSSFWFRTGLWGFSVGVARVLLDDALALPTWVRIFAALLPVVPTILMLRVIVASLRELDELHRKVHLEALAVAYPLAILLLVTLGFLQLAVELPAADWSFRHIWPMLICFYFVGLAISWRRYR